MKLEEIKNATLSGKTVYWKDENYRVTNVGDEWYIKSASTRSQIGLTWADGVTLNGKECDFYVKD